MYCAQEDQDGEECLSEMFELMKIIGQHKKTIEELRKTDSIMLNVHMIESTDNITLYNGVCTLLEDGTKSISLGYNPSSFSIIITK